MNTTLIDFTIGSDPEFGCLDRHNRIVTASDHITDTGLENDDTGDEFGYDGNGVTFEVRPKPSKDPIQLVNNIHDIFVRKVIEKPKFLEFNWIAGSWHSGYPFGGHVHFGIPNHTFNHQTAIKHLDNYVGIISLLMEVKSHGVKRRSDGYGCMGDFRQQDWGFEYRPMSSWVSSPYIAAMLCLSKTVMYEALNNSNFKWHNFAKTDDFPKMNQERIFGIFPEIWSDITKMYLYQVYKPYIDLIYFLIKNKLTWLPASGMKESWGVVDMKPCINNKIGLDVIWHRYNNEMVAQ